MLPPVTAASQRKSGTAPTVVKPKKKTGKKKKAAKGESEEQSGKFMSFPSIKVGGVTIYLQGSCSVEFQNGKISIQAARLPPKKK